RLSQGEGFPDPVFWQPPLYSLMLAGLYSVFGHALLWPRLLQCALGAIMAALSCNLAERATGERRAGVAAGLLVALHGPLIFYEGELLPTVLATFLGLLALWLALAEAPSVSRAAMSGAAIGLGALAVAPTLLLVVPVGGWLLRTRRALGLCCVAACVLCVLPATLANRIRGGEWLPISSNGGVNLWIGNNADADRAIAIRPGAGWEALVEEPARKGLRTRGQQDAYFVRKAVGWCTSQPWACLKNLGWKARLLLASRELPRNEDLAVIRKDSPVLSVLAPQVGGAALPYALLLPLAAAGAVRAFRERNRLLLRVLAAAGALAAAPVLFFVTGRYRIPLAPLVCILAAVGLVELLSRQQRRWPAGLAAAALLAVAVWPVRLAVDDIDFEAEMHYVIGGRRARLGNQQGAVEAWGLALAKRPDYLEAGFNRALALEGLGKPREAATTYEAVLQHHPDHLVARVRHGFALLEARELPGAHAAFTALANNTRTAPVGLLGLARVALARGELDAATTLLNQAEQRGGQSQTSAEVRRGIEAARRPAP
ncbi:MAG TPA: glycosyltransferase family 39 protein, partial [Myxococcus sp.]|nr:glycosyltransferase family 39 protein [Myxococcus sp.]